MQKIMKTLKMKMDPFQSHNHRISRDLEKRLNKKETEKEQMGGSAKRKWHNWNGREDLRMNLKSEKPFNEQPKVK